MYSKTERLASDQVFTSLRVWNRESLCQACEGPGSRRLVFESGGQQPPNEGPRDLSSFLRFLPLRTDGRPSVHLKASA